jgi:hypothetical protein
MDERLKRQYSVVLATNARAENFLVDVLPSEPCRHIVVRLVDPTLIENPICHSNVV